MKSYDNRPTGLTRDPWAALRAQTRARIALGRAGGSLPSEELLKFSLDHAEARDAVHSALDVDTIVHDLHLIGLNAYVLHSQATDRDTYLKRPDLGRKLDEKSAQILKSIERGGDVALIIADGLSALATQSHAVAVVKLLISRLKAAQITLAPLTIVTQARVAIQDEIGAALGAHLAVILLGERPGLGTADSLGAYLVYHPAAGNTDANRNCVSNIRPGGLQLDRAAETISHLIIESFRRKMSGIHLKDERTAFPYAPDRPSNAIK